MAWELSYTGSGAVVISAFAITSAVIGAGLLHKALRHKSPTFASSLVFITSSCCWVWLLYGGMTLPASAQHQPWLAEQHVSRAMQHFAENRESMTVQAPKQETKRVRMHRAL